MKENTQKASEILLKFISDGDIVFTKKNDGFHLICNITNYCSYCEVSKYIYGSCNNYRHGLFLEMLKEEYPELLLWDIKIIEKYQIT